MSDDGRAAVKLREPIQFGSELVSELRFRRPKAKDFRRIKSDGHDFDMILTLAGRLCGQPSQVIDELGLEDMQEVIELVGGFMPSGLATGESS